MLLFVVGFVDGAQEPFLRVVDGYDGQTVEGRFVGLAPQDVAVLHRPVAEGDEHVREFQSLRLVNTNEADAVHLGALYGELAERLVPFGKEGRDVGRLLVDVGTHLVEERKEIGALPLHVLQLEDGAEPFREFVERQPQQFVAMLGKLSWEHAVERSFVQGLMCIHACQIGF